MTANHAGLMDKVYRRQTKIYDLTRKYYLFGRDNLIQHLDPGAGGSVLEIGCGTGRNLIAAARRYPSARFHGIDISTVMLERARRKVPPHLALAQADATRFDARALFGVDHFDRVFISYALSMIPDWQAALRAAAEAVAPGGRLLVVDFGQQERLPRIARVALTAWLRKFHVSPCANLAFEFRRVAFDLDAVMQFRAIGGGYAWLMTLEKPSRSASRIASA
jgi:S-adenosylmethionine-diacylgycerolhomoserine-N-methlytransferase